MLYEYFEMSKIDLKNLTNSCIAPQYFNNWVIL